MLYVVRRTFKNHGEAIVPGTVVDPTSIKRFKSKLRDHVIIEVPESDFDKWNSYFIAKFGTEIKLPDQPKADDQPKKTVVVAAVKK